tara:strand:- start:1215 stop:6614 length:5400 start_codon:yes stop_codon:yes gene_type:complete
MPENISTYWAKNVKINTLRGNKFEFVLNVKNEDGSDYVFPEGHVAFFAAFKNLSNPVGTIMPTSTGAPIPFNTLVEDGKITVNTLGGEEGFYPIVGTYSYILFTYNPDDIGINLEDLMEDIIPNWHLRVGWMSEELTELWTSPYESDSNILQNGYYDEWFHVVGDEGLYPCYLPEWKVLQANQENGTNLYYEDPQIDFPYINQDYIDNNEVWSDNKLTYKDGMEELLLKTTIHRKNVVRCIFDEREYMYKWSVIPIPVRYNTQCATPDYAPQTETFTNINSWTNLDGDSFTFHTGNYPWNIGPYISNPTEEENINWGYASNTDYYVVASNWFENQESYSGVDFQSASYTDNVFNYLEPYEGVYDLWLNQDEETDIWSSTSLNMEEYYSPSAIIYGIHNYFYEASLELAANYTPGDLLWYPSETNLSNNPYFSVQMFFSGLSPSDPIGWGVAPYGSSVSDETSWYIYNTLDIPVNVGQGVNDWRRINPVKVGLPYAPVESLEDLNQLLAPPPMGISDFFNIMFGGAALEYPDAFPWWSYYQTGSTSNNNVPYLTNYSAIFAEGEETTDAWIPFYYVESLVDWDEDYLIYPKTSYFLDMFAAYPELGHIPTDAIGIEEPSNIMLEQLGSSFPDSSAYPNFPASTNTPGWNLIPYLGIESTMWNYLNYTNEADLPGFVLSGGGDVTYWGVPTEDAYLQEPVYNEFIIEFDGITYDLSSWGIEQVYDDDGMPIINTIQEQQAWYGNNFIDWQTGEPSGNYQGGLLYWTPFASSSSLTYGLNQSNYQLAGMPPLPQAISNFISNTAGLDGTIYEPWWLMSNSNVNLISEVDSIFSNQTYNSEQSPVTAFDIGINNGIDFLSSQYDGSQQDEGYFNQSYSPQFDVYISGFILNGMSVDKAFYTEGTNIGVGEIRAVCRITRPDGTGFPVKPEFNDIYGLYTTNEDNTINPNVPGVLGESQVNPYGLGLNTQVFNLNDPDTPTTIIPIAEAFMPNFKPTFDGSISTNSNPTAGEPGAYEFLFRFVTPFGGFMEHPENNLQNVADTGWDFIDWDNAGDRKFVVEYRFKHLKTMSPPFVPNIGDWSYQNYFKSVDVFDAPGKSLLEYDGYEQIIGRNNSTYGHEKGIWSFGTTIVKNDNYPEVPNPENSPVFEENPNRYRLDLMPMEGKIIKFYLNDVGAQVNSSWSDHYTNTYWDWHGEGSGFQTSENNEYWNVAEGDTSAPSNVYKKYDYFNPYFKLSIIQRISHVHGNFHFDLNRFTDLMWDGALLQLGAPQGSNYSAAMWGVELNPEHNPYYHIAHLPFPGESLFKHYGNLSAWSNSDLPRIEFDMHYLNETTGETGIVECKSGNTFYNTQTENEGLNAHYDEENGNSITGAGNTGQLNINTPDYRKNWDFEDATDDTSHYEQLEARNTLDSPIYIARVGVNSNYNRIFWDGYATSNTQEDEIITSYYGMTYDEINSFNPGYAGFLSLSPLEDRAESRNMANRHWEFTVVLPKKPEWQGHDMKFWFESKEHYTPRVIGGPPPELGGTNPWWQMEEICLRFGVFSFGSQFGLSQKIEINAQNCLYTEVFWTPEIMAEWPTDPETGAFIPAEHPNGSGQLIYGKVYAYWIPPGNPRSPFSIRALAKSIRRVYRQGFEGTPAQGDPTRIVEKKAEIRASGTAMTMDLMRLTLNDPPEYNIFEYIVKITKADDPEFIYDTFEIDGSVPFPEDFENYDWTQPFSVTNQTTVFLGEMGIPDGEELQFHIKPKEGYRQFDPMQESYIRLAGTYFSTTWGNNSYLSEDVLTPVKANYWLYGDFVVKKNNENE